MPQSDKDVIEYASKRPLRRKAMGWANAFSDGLLTVFLPIVAIFVVLLLIAGRPKLGRHGSAKQESTLAQMADLSEALHKFRDDNGRFPTQAEGLDALVHQPPATPAWRQLIEDMPCDGWGNQIRYEFPGKKNPGSFDLRSAGEDGAFGTPDDIVQ